MCTSSACIQQYILEKRTFSRRELPIEDADFRFLQSFVGLREPARDAAERVPLAAFNLVDLLEEHPLLGGIWFRVDFVVLWGTITMISVCRTKARMLGDTHRA